MLTSREEAKQARRRQLLQAAAEIMARQGFAQTRLSDIGAAAGISGPGLYRHFANKDDILAQLLLEISHRLVAQAQAIVAAAGEEDPRVTLRKLLDVHIEVAVTEPDTVLVQQREIQHLAEGPREEVKALQRTYLNLWADTLQRVYPEFDRGTARLRVQLTAGLINSARFVVHWAGPELLRREARAMAYAAILVEGDSPS